MVFYKYSIGSDTLNGKVYSPSLGIEIGSADLGSPLSFINTDDDDMFIHFPGSLTAGDQTTLTTVVGSHTGDIPDPEPAEVDIVDKGKFPIRTKTVLWRTSGPTENLNAGQTKTWLDISKKGTLLGIFIDVEGQHTKSNKSELNVYFNGETEPSIKIKMARLKSMNEGTFTPTRYGGVTKYDDANFIYVGHINPESDFNDGVKITMTNGDDVRSTTIKGIVMYKVKA